MELIIAVIVFGALLAIALFGLAMSNRAARLNNASRHAGGQPSTPMTSMSQDRPTDRACATGPDRIDGLDRHPAGHAAVMPGAPSPLR